MTTFRNQIIGSRDDNSLEYVSIWFEECVVSSFSFHSIGTRDVCKRYHRVHGVSVCARHVFAAIDAFNSAPEKAIGPDGKSFWVTQVHFEDGTKELRAGDRWGKPIARMTRTGYIQPSRDS